jgi:hypothetical protein
MYAGPQRNPATPHAAPIVSCGVAGHRPCETGSPLDDAAVELVHPAAAAATATTTAHPAHPRELAPAFTTPAAAGYAA